MKSLKQIFATLITLHSFFLLQVQATALYVDINSTNPVSPYVSWATAATNIPDAVAQAVSGDTVLVTNGTYTLSAQVTVDSITLESVNGPEVTLVEGPGVTLFQVPSGAGTTWINGFTIQNASWGVNASGNPLNAGVSNCVFRSVAFFALVGGSAIDCVFTNNIGNQPAFSLKYAENCTFVSNSPALGFSGALYMSSPSDIASNCVFIGNSKGGETPGAFARGIAIDCTFVGNTGGIGGAIRNATAINCVFSNNLATIYGGAMGDGSATNCLFVNNHSDGEGGAIHDSTAYGCEFVGNTAVTEGGGAYNSTVNELSLIHISEPTRQTIPSRMPSSA